MQHKHGTVTAAAHSVHHSIWSGLWSINPCHIAKQEMH